MKQQTAVEYLIEQLLPKALSQEQYYHIEKAKEMEKKQQEQIKEENEIHWKTTLVTTKPIII
jgi:SAM-dependent MidA family methyltransferase